ncbi:MAG TPA: hypothetical protein VKC60_08335, partial [Opitutaceae bacterium]|nr:hypothetical protein [Opitutaceae bacterium]
AGRHEAVWSTEVQADASGTVDFEVEVENEKTRGQVRIAEPTPKRILYFQGALDWSYRFLANILRRDSSFVLTPVFTFPNARAVAPQGVLPKFPNTVAQLQGYDIVVLSNVAGNQLNAAQQNALTAWVRGGGILLFFTPDDDSTQGLSGSELEKILPVVFAPPQSRAQEDTSTRELLQQLARLRQYRAGSVNGDELAPDATPPPKLNPFAWEEHSRAQEIFSEAQKAGQALGTPLFTAYAHVASAKPGAEVLARHPVDTTPGKSEHAILLAMQRYGRGQTAVLTSDALWRWKLNQPSEQRGVELFWQNLFGWLARERQSGLQFEHMRLHTEVGADYDMRISGAADSAVTLEAVQRERHVAIGGGRDDATARVFRWKPPSEGQWEIHATDDQGREARHWVSVETTSKRGELSGLPPNEGLMRELAGRTGGALIEANSLPPWQAARDNGGDLITERHDALWDRPWVFGILLLLYASELILRRTSKLL